MPIVDGLTSTKMIRAFENSGEHGGHSSIANHNGRIPIFAVSASLIEREREKYVSAGFDGWILKPIDFRRLNTLLLGIVEDDIRATCLYAPGQWERGGWFNVRDCSGGEEKILGKETSDDESATPTGQDGVTKKTDGTA